MLFRHSAIYILAKLIPGLMAFIALSIYTHLLSPDQYGIYTLLFTGTVFLHNVIFNWLPAGTLRFWSSSDYTESEFTNTLIISYAKIFFCVFIITLLGIVYYWGKEPAVWIANGFILLIALSIYTITQNIFNASIRPAEYAYLTIAYSVLALCFGWFLASLGYGASGVIFGIALGTIIPALIVFKSTWLPFKITEYNPELFKRLFIYGMPLAAATLVEEVTKVSDRFMLAAIHGKAEAGLYAVGYDLSGNSILMIMAAINVAAYPVIIKLLDSDGIEVATEYFSKYVVLLLGVSIPAVVGLNLVGPNLVHLLIDVDYHTSVIYLLPWITIAIFLMGLQVFYFDLAFQLGKKTIDSVKIAVIIAIVNICINYQLIPNMGLKGAAIATICSFAIGCMLSAYQGRKYFTLPFPTLDAIKIVAATSIMAALLWNLRDNIGWFWLLAQLLIGLLSFVFMMWVLNILNIRKQFAEFLADRM